jgi:hypothetical protein
MPWPLFPFDGNRRVLFPLAIHCARFGADRHGNEAFFIVLLHRSIGVGSSTDRERQKTAKADLRSST